MFSSPTRSETPALTSLPEAAPPRRTAFHRPRALPLLVMGLVVPGIFCTVALPAYASIQPSEGAAATAQLEALKTADAQSFAVAIDAALATTASDRDAYKAVSAAEMARRAQAALYASYSGPTVADLLKNPPYPNYDMSKVVEIARTYLGVPYRFGGADPSGFDCSGFTQFVFAHVGISLPHSSSAQGRLTAIDPAAARPGDIVVLDGGGHVGIYIGNGQMIHSPYPGTVVRVGNLWGSYWFVRPGI